jgi:hypothetical protein
MIKCLPCDGYDLGEPAVSLVKNSSRGLIGSDRRSLLKRASEEFAAQFDKVAMQPGDVAAHLLIVGATELYGPNRNKDGFRKAACREFHPTFVKYARCYRNHVNKDPNKSYGYIKLSHYNPRMHRIELLAIYNSTKEAAARNGGLLADLELQDLESRGEFPTSMACKLPYDHCSHCGNAARSRDEYCRGLDEGGQCKAGGLYRNIGAITNDPDNPILHADNREKVAFFDASRVPRQADLIAYALGIAKTASAADIKDGLTLAAAMQAGAPLELEVTDRNVQDFLKTARHLAAAEARLANRVSGFRLAFPDELSLPDAANLSVIDKLAALTQRGVVLPVSAFFQLVGGKTVQADTVEAVRSRIAGATQRMLEDDAAFNDIAANSLVFASNSPTKQALDWAEGLSAYTVTDATAARARIAEAVIDGGPMKEKSAAVQDPAVDKLAELYAGYKVAVLTQIQNCRDFDLATALVIAQN